MTDDIAVIGLGCLFPGAPDVPTFWRNIVSKTSAITDPPPEAWDQQLYFDPSSDDNDRVYCKKGGYLGRLAQFDPLEHGIMPRAVEGGEPDQWLALHVARQTLADAGCADAGRYRERAALILGKGTYANRGTISVVHHGVVIDHMLDLLKTIHPELTDYDLQLVRHDLKRQLPRFDAETAPALIPNVTVGRIANRLDLMGPSFTVDAACASSLVAVDLAAKGLRQREFDMALVGGMQVATPLPVLSLFCRLNALSPAQSIRPFDKDADGTLLSEGIGMALLKRRDDAERDGDRIYAIVRGTGVASDGRAVSVLAPRVEGEELAVRRAYENAGVPPHSIGLIEAHGTATLVGDAVELDALRRVFGDRNEWPRCALGSVKSMIGHTMPAAGMAGFIKATLALYHKLLPPTLNVTQPSPRLNLDRTPFYINSETRPWVHGGAKHPRRAGVNAFGFGGINAHVVLEETAATADAHGGEVPRDAEVCLFAGATRAEVVARVRQTAANMASAAAPALGDVARTLAHQAADLPAKTGVCLGIVATSRSDLAAKIERALTRLNDASCRRIKDVSGIYFYEEPLGPIGKLAFLFPGEGAQYVNMFADLCCHFPAVRACFDEMDRPFADHPRGYLLSDIVFPPPAFSDEERTRAERRLWQMDVAVEATLTANHAMHTLLTQFGITPDVVVGHSTGEYSAMRAAGMLDGRDYEERVNELNRVYEGANAAGRVPSAACLLAVAASREQVNGICERAGGGAMVAMDNCPHQVVIVASPDAADRIEPLLRAEGLLYERLRFDRPYHTPAFAEYTGELRRWLDKMIARAPGIPLYSATTGGLFPTELDAIQQLACEHWVRPVEFRRTVETMHADGVRLFVEVGPRGNLTTFVEDTLAHRPFAAIPANVTQRSGLTQLAHLVAHLAAHRVPMTLAPLYPDASARSADRVVVPAGTARKSALGPIKIPTGAPTMRLSPDIAAHIRSAVARLYPERAMADKSRVSWSGGSGESGGSGPAMSADSIRQINLPDLPDRLDRPDLKAREAVMAAFTSTMSRFLDTQRDLLVHTLQQQHDTAPRPRSLPFIDTVLEHSPGRSLVARCTLDLDLQPALRDHTLGRHLSAHDPSLPGFPIVPFTLMMELLAEAASVLAPSSIVIGMRDVRVHRWLALDRGPLTIEINGELSGPEHATVRVFDADSGSTTPVAEGVMVLARAYPPAPAAHEIDMRDAHAYKWSPDRLYEEAMFHGPSFRGVASMDGVSATAAEATLTVTDRGGLAADGRGGLVTDLVLLDQPGQVVGFWASQFLERGFLVLPFRMESLQLFGPLLPPGERVRCQARIALVGEQHVRSSLDIVRADGRVWARFDGWEDRRFDLPARMFRMLLEPHSVQLSEPVTLPEDGSGVLTGRRLGLNTFPEHWLTAHSGLWSRVLASVVLSRRERERWHALKLPEGRRVEWLLARVAAKEAVHHVVRQHVLRDLHPADIEITADESGCPRVGGEWLGDVPFVPHVSLSHVDGVALAVAAASTHAKGVGVDLERIGRLQRASEPIAFTASERALLDQLDDNERQAWALRFWCAREACAKATGYGMADGLHAFVVHNLDRQRGTLHVYFDAPGKAPLELAASTAQDGDWIVGTCAMVVKEGART